MFINFVLASCATGSRFSVSGGGSKESLHSLKVSWHWIIYDSISTHAREGYSSHFVCRSAWEFLSLNRYCLEVNQKLSLFN